MYHDELWNQILDNLLAQALEKYNKTFEFCYSEKQQQKIDCILCDNLMPDQKELVEECILDILEGAALQTKAVYRQGMADCAQMLKHLGVLA